MSFTLMDKLGVAGPAGREVRRIFLRDLAVELEIGIHGFEKGRTQRVLVNVEMFLGPAHTGDGDDIDAVLDYDFVRDGVTELARAGRYNLQETFCRAIAEMVMARPEVLAARVSTEKPDVYPDCDAVGYELTIARD